MKSDMDVSLLWCCLEMAVACARGIMSSAMRGRNRRMIADGVRGEVLDSKARVRVTIVSGSSGGEPDEGVDDINGWG
jgi:hypothetical protein